MTSTGPSPFAHIDWFMLVVVVIIPFIVLIWPQMRAAFVHWDGARKASRDRMTMLDGAHGFDSDIETPVPIDWSGFAPTIVPAFFVVMVGPVAKAWGYDIGSVWFYMVPFGLYALYKTWEWLRTPPEIRAELRPETGLQETLLGFDLPREGWIGLVGALMITGGLIVGFAMFLA